MNRRAMIQSMGIAALGGTMLSGNGLNAQDHHEQHGKTRAGSGGAKAIADCMVSCQEGFHHCFELVAEGKKEHARAMHLLGDCAEICGTSAALAARKSELARDVLQACARACETCASECEKFSDEMMQHCARTCRETAKICRESPEKRPMDGGMKKEKEK